MLSLVFPSTYQILQKHCRDSFCISQFPQSSDPFFQILFRSFYFSSTLRSPGTAISIIIPFCSFLSITIRSGCLVSLRLSRWIFMPHSTLISSFSTAPCGAYSHHFWLCSKLFFLQTSQWTNIPTLSCRLLHSFWANYLPIIIIIIIVVVIIIIIIIIIIIVIIIINVRTCFKLYLVALVCYLYIKIYGRAHKAFGTMWWVSFLATSVTGGHKFVKKWDLSCPKKIMLFAMLCCSVVNFQGVLYK